jgi:hypothetical protein
MQTVEGSDSILYIDHQGIYHELGALIPKDLVLPAAIGFLGVVIIGVFFASRK